MEHQPVLDDKGQDGKGIKDSPVHRLCVYAGSSWTLQKTKTDLCAMMNKNDYHVNSGSASK